MNPIDLRSDTITLPTEKMLERMRHAELGDDSRDGDPTVRALESLAARRTGKEAACFMPSGTMTNLVATLAHTGRGGEVLLEAESHIARTEMGGVGNLAGLFHRALPGRRGAIDLDALKDAVSPGLTPNRLATALICTETTHNAAGGAILPLDHMAELQTIAKAHGVPVHIDGARLFNAAIGLGVPADRIAAFGDSVTFCVSKGLSAPIGSVLCGSEDFILRARAFRRMVGGNLRQAGVVAAAGVVALEDMVERLADDHRAAKRLAEGLHSIDPRLANPSDVETNIVNTDVSASRRNAAEWTAALKPKGIVVTPARPWRLRLVTHRHVGMAEVERALGAFADAWRTLAR
ncbi:MAG TPA: GntG family PLP-dependent aldolase [Alphaproteobacteria bacterium]